MNFLKGWAQLISGAIIFTALCEILLPQGSTKKYIRLILGMILTLAIIKPMESFSSANFSYDLFDFEKSLAYKTADEKEKSESELIIKLYKENLEDNIKKRLKKDVNADFFLDISVSEDSKNFGEIKNALIKVYQQDGFRDFRKEIYSIMKNDFGVDEEKIVLKFTNTPDGEG